MFFTIKKALTKYLIKCCTIFLCLYLFYGCNQKNVYEIQLLDNLTVSWNPNDKWIEKDENYDKLKSDFKNLEMKLIETLVDTTVLFDVCFKDKPFRKGDLALICLVDIGSTHQIYQPGMLHVKLLNQNDPCYFLFYNHIYHLEKNRNEYYQYIKSNKMPSEHLQ